MKNIQFINENNKQSLNKPADTDQVYYSELNEWYTTNAFRSLSVKLVLQGSIYYKVDHREYKVEKQQFLLATKQPDIKAYFKSDEITKSVCIDICKNSLDEAFTVLQSEQKNEVPGYGSQYMEHPYFSENIYNLNQDELGNKLGTLRDIFEHSLPSQDLASINREWFLEMIELIILTQFRNYKLLNNLNALKPGTKKEILKRIISGRDYIDMNFLKNPDIKLIAMESNMSEFHFYRCFKQVFEVSPYQYMLGKRLDHAGERLSQRDLLVSEIAAECGFADVFTFSKAFKKKFGLSPTRINRLSVA